MPALTDLNERQNEILAFVRGFIRARNYSPTVREIVDGCELSSTSVASYNLRVLYRRGYVIFDEQRARSITLPKPALGASCPLCGRQ